MNCLYTLLSLSGNSGRLTWVRLQQLQEQRSYKCMLGLCVSVIHRILHISTLSRSGILRTQKLRTRFGDPRAIKGSLCKAWSRNIALHNMLRLLPGQLADTFLPPWFISPHKKTLCKQRLRNVWVLWTDFDLWLPSPCRQPHTDFEGFLSPCLENEVCCVKSLPWQKIIPTQQDITTFVSVASAF